MSAFTFRVDETLKNYRHKVSLFLTRGLILWPTSLKPPDLPLNVNSSRMSIITSSKLFMNALKTKLGSEPINLLN